MAPSINVLVLAPMPLEMDAITAAFGLNRASSTSPWKRQVGATEVTAIHVGMGPETTRRALTGFLAEPGSGATGYDHVMIAGICGGLDPALPVGTLVIPELLLDYASGAAFSHHPPGDFVARGTLVTTETATLDHELSRQFFEQGCIGVDMESVAVAEVCEDRGISWSVYRCIGDRYFDGLLDERVLSLANPDGSGDSEALSRLLAEDPGIAERLERLAHDASAAARSAAEAAYRGCLALADA